MIIMKLLHDHFLTRVRRLGHVAEATMSDHFDLFFLNHVVKLRGVEAEFFGNLVHLERLGAGEQWIEERYDEIGGMWMLEAGAARGKCLKLLVDASASEGRRRMRCVRKERNEGSRVKKKEMEAIENRVNLRYKDEGVGRSGRQRRWTQGGGGGKGGVRGEEDCFKFRSFILI